MRVMANLTGNSFFFFLKCVKMCFYFEKSQEYIYFDQRLDFL